MGVSIGESVSTLAAPRAGRVVAPVPNVRALPGTPAADRQRDRQERLEVGFGANTVSVPGVALRTVDRNLENARKAVPSAAEIQEELRARLDEEQEKLRTAQESARVASAPAEATDDRNTEPTEPLVSFRPAPDPQVRNFEVAGVRAEGSAPAPQSSFLPAGAGASERLDILI